MPYLVENGFYITLVLDSEHIYLPAYGSLPVSHMGNNCVILGAILAEVGWVWGYLNTDGGRLRPSRLPNRILPELAGV